MSVRIKVCGLANADNYRQINALRPDYAGHIFYARSPRYVAPEKVATWPKTAQVQRVGVFVNEDAGRIWEIVSQSGLDAVQLHGAETPAYCRDLRQYLPRIALIKSLAVDENFVSETLTDYAEYCDYFLCDTPTTQHGGSGRVFDWGLLHKIVWPRPFFLGGGLGPHNVAAALAACAGLPLYAVDVNSRVESAPGVKSTKLVQEFIGQVRI